MNTDPIVETLNSAKPDEMAQEDTIADEPVTPPVQLTSPILDLTSGLDIDASGDIEQPLPEQGELDGVAPPVRIQSKQGFRIGELRLMIGYEDASELAEMHIVHSLPNAPEWFCGIANLHGKLIPVFDLARYFGVDPVSGVKRLLLVISRGNDATGVLIDGMPERLHCFEDEYSEAGAQPERLMPHLRGATLIGEQLWFDLDTHSLINAIEQSLEQLQ
jgi:chemotaxis signal transduction protein